MTSISNSELITMIRTDEREGFAQVYEQYWETLLKYVIRILPDEDEACDVVQETFLTLWELRNTIPKLKSIKAYLLVIARNLAFKQLRAKLATTDMIDFYAAQYADTYHRMDQHLESKELGVALEEEIQQLPEKMREVFLLSRQQHLSYKEISERLNISDKTVKKQIHNALKLLRMKVDEEYIPYLILFLIFDICC